MSETQNSATSPSVIEERAAEWLIARLHDENWTPDKEARLEEWLGKSIAHEVAYLRLEAGWNGADRLAVLRAPQRTPFPPTMSPLGNKKYHLAAVFLLCAGIGSGAYLTTKSSPEQVFVTPVGGRETITLTDGSQIELNTNTELRLPKGSRSATLVRGEAYFQIKHDSERPFTLEAGNHRVVDLGTKFVVRQKANEIEVTLLEGSARIEAASNSAHSKSAVLTPGDVAVATSDDLSVRHKPANRLADALGWRSGFVVFHHTMLREAVSELNRYNTQQIVVSDDAASRVFGGKFHTTDSERFADVVGAALGLNVEHRGSKIVISGK